MFSSANQAWATRWGVITKYVMNLIMVNTLTQTPALRNQQQNVTISYKRAGHVLVFEIGIIGCSIKINFSWYKPLNVFMNPEYERAQPKFIEKCIEQVKIGAVEKAAILIPARTDTKMFIKTILNNAEGDEHMKDVWYSALMSIGNLFGHKNIWDLINPNRKVRRMNCLVRLVSSMPFSHSQACGCNCDTRFHQ